jgi:hypothetical protein
VNAKPKRRWFQFSLKTLLVVLTLCAFGMGYRRVATAKVRVTGVVTYEGRPIPWAAVCFFKTNGTGYSGVTGPDGRFKMIQPENGEESLALGRYYVFVIVNDSFPDAVRRKWWFNPTQWEPNYDHVIWLWPTASEQRINFALEK